MKIYHGYPSPAKYQRCVEAAPGLSHGAEWGPGKMTPHDWPYILDNGAFAADRDGTEWDPRPFLRRLGEIPERMPREPDFVVLPDIRGGGEESLTRSTRWATRLRDMGHDYPFALPVQDGISARKAVDTAADLDVTTLFIGGSDRWCRRQTPTIATEAGRAGLHVHVGKPLSLDWALHTDGVDSVDTTSIVRHDAYHKLRAACEQSHLTSFE